MDLDRDRLLQLPKAELHVHLDGSLRASTIVELAHEQGKQLPSRDPVELERIVRAKRHGSLEEYIARFELTLSVLQTASGVERVAFELAVDAASENIRYLEVRFSPLLMARDGLDPHEAVEASLRGLARAEAGHDLATGVTLCALRDMDPVESMRLVELAIGFRHRGVVAVDLAGPEAGHPASEHAAAFRTALESGLSVTLHAGEAAGPESIRQALHDCGAQRIGHGTRLFEDRDLMLEVRDAGIPVEICLTSNVQTGATSSLERHPLRLYFDEGLVVCLCTDNRFVSGTTLTREYQLAYSLLGFSWAELQEIARMGFRSTFESSLGS